MKNITLRLAIIVVILGAFFLGYYLKKGQVDVVSISTIKTQPENKKINYPVDSSHVTSDDDSADGEKPASHPATKLPPRDQSDALIEKMLGKLIGIEQFRSLFYVHGLVRKFVVTVDNATNPRIPTHFSVFKPLGQEIKVEEQSAGPVLSPDNYAHYSEYIDLLSSLSLKKLVSIYARFYSLFQKAYDETGSGGYFNDRLVAVIDIMLAAPPVNQPVPLIAGGYYKFADSKLEELPAAQKIMIRMGPTNAEVVKQKLREIRDLLTQLNKK